MEIQFQCNFADYREALRFLVKRTVGYQVLLALGVVSVLLGTLVAYKVDYWRGFFLQLGGIFWLSWFVIIQPLWVRRDFHKHPNFSVPQVVTLNDEGFHSVSDIAQGTAKWTAFTKFHETQNFFMLLMGARLFRVIPKRALSAAQIDELRQLLHRHLPNR
jgi:hypothetical protein